MKLRESDMPDEAFWETLFDIPLILGRLGVDANLGDVVELGCGYGTFTVPVARRVSGTLRTCDIDPAMVERTARRAAALGVHNIVCEQRDVLTDGFGVGPEFQDVCLLFNILHGEEPLRILGQAARVVRPSGWVHVIHWRYDPTMPRGASMDIRPCPEQVLDWGSQAGLTTAGPVIDLPPWHYGIRFRRAVEDS